jgi:hypothetical protein
MANDTEKEVIVRDPFRRIIHVLERLLSSGKDNPA